MVNKKTIALTMLLMLVPITTPLGAANNQDEAQTETLAPTVIIRKSEGVTVGTHTFAPGPTLIGAVAYDYTYTDPRACGLPETEVILFADEAIQGTSYNGRAIYIAAGGITTAVFSGSVGLTFNTLSTVMTVSGSAMVGIGSHAYAGAGPAATFTTSTISCADYQP